MFSLTQEQLKKLNDWYEDLGVKHYSGAIGGALTYTFTPTGLGVVTVVKEFHTGKEINLTDYSDW